MVCTFAGVDVAEHWHLIDEPTQWLVNDVFACGQPTIVGAKQKSLKTTLMADLAVCLATGFSWLRKFKVPKQRRILVITGEASLKSALKKIGQAADSLNVKPEQLKGWVRVEAVHFPTLPRQEDCDAVALAIHEHDIDVCILDPLYMGLEGLNTANLTEVGPAMRRFMAACKPAEVIICHHVKKTASFDDAPNLEDLSQAGIAEFAGNYWLMGRMSEYMGDGQHEIAIRTGGRDDQFHLLKMDFDELVWRAEFTDLVNHRENKKQRRENEQMGKWRLMILKHLKRNNGQASIASAAEACGTKRSREGFQNVLEEMEEHEEIIHCKVKGRNHKICKGLKLKGQTSTDGVL